MVIFDLCSSWFVSLKKPWKMIFNHCNFPHSLPKKEPLSFLSIVLWEVEIRAFFWFKLAYVRKFWCEQTLIGVNFSKLNPACLFSVSKGLSCVNLRQRVELFFHFLVSEKFWYSVSRQVFRRHIISSAVWALSTWTKWQQSMMTPLMSRSTSQDSNKLYLTSYSWQASDTPQESRNR